MSILILVLQLVYFFLPAAFANMAPVLFRNHFTALAKPIDGGKLFYGKPLFGSHKTWRGLIIATVMGGIVFLIQQLFAAQFPFTQSWSPFALQELPWWFGFAFGAGAIIGDLIKSFFKRRVNVDPGKSWFPFDQIDALLGSAFVASFFVGFTLGMWILIIVFGIGIHVLVKYIGYLLQLEKTPW